MVTRIRETGMNSFVFGIAFCVVVVIALVEFSIVFTEDLPKMTPTENDKRLLQGTGQDDWKTGVLLSVGSTIATALGNHMVTASHKQTKQSDGDAIMHMRPMHLRASFWCWVLGNLNITLIGTSMTLASYAYASPSLLAPLSGLVIVWNALLATTKWFGRQRLTEATIVSTCVTLLGCVIVVFAGPRNSEDFPLSKLIELFKRPLFLIYCVCVTAVGGVLWTRTKAKTLPVSRFAHGSLAGLVGGLGNVLAKAFVELLKDTNGQTRSNQTSDAFFQVLIVVATILAASTQMILLNVSLKKFQPLYVVPIYQTTLLLSATISGGLYYEDFFTFSVMQSIAFVLGLALVMKGVYDMSAADDGTQAKIT